MTALPNVLLDQPALTKLIWLRLCTSPEPMTQAELAHDLATRHDRVGNHLRRLVEQGLVQEGPVREREHSQSSGRLALTYRAFGVDLPQWREPPAGMKRSHARFLVWLWLGGYVRQVAAELGVSLATVRKVLS